jgi:DNA polymerase-3 subunit epsilon
MSEDPKSNPAASLPQAVRAAGGCLHADDAARRLFRSMGNGGPAGRHAVLALAALDPGLVVGRDAVVRLAAPQAPETPLDRARFVVLDLETTGSRAGTDRVTEVGAVQVAGGRIQGEFQTLVRPDCPIPPAITRLTGIHELLLAGAPRFSQVAGRLVDFLGSGTLVAHNAAFDLRFLVAELARAGLPPPANPVLCTVRLARRLLPELRSCNLDSLATHFGFRFQARHRALGDAQVTAQLLRELLKISQVRGADSLGQLMDLSRRRTRKATRKGA